MPKHCQTFHHEKLGLDDIGGDSPVVVFTEFILLNRDSSLNGPRLSLHAQVFVATQQLESTAWHPSGKKMMSSHNDGSYIVWRVTADDGGGETPAKSEPSASTPYGPFPCKAITKILWNATDDESVFLLFLVSLVISLQFYSLPVVFLVITGCDCILLGLRLLRMILCRQSSELSRLTNWVLGFYSIQFKFPGLSQNLAESKPMYNVIGFWMLKWNLFVETSVFVPVPLPNPFSILNLLLRSIHF